MEVNHYHLLYRIIKMEFFRQSSVSLVVFFFRKICIIGIYKNKGGIIMDKMMIIAGIILLISITSSKLLQYQQL